MKIVISGYGRMGHEVEKIALSRSHIIIATVDNDIEWSEQSEIIKTADVVIDFSLPQTATKVFEKCFELGVPIVTGTTGWYEDLESVRVSCEKNNACFFYSHNFSIGVNIFFEANKLIASLTAAANNYSVGVEETHHVHKMDSPSGTAIKVAEDIISEYQELKEWKNYAEVDKSQLPIKSYREGEVIGSHSVDYHSNIDHIRISHIAKNRSGFALGAILAAEYVFGKKGFFSMSDLMKDLQK
ncbi:MAG: 4-hydroxy-tetrahydrodipicolinate reductase [Marinilabiliales bacterium]|nr:MAG: 4-hydroxy-tetrahydrodipicolinate reductase [Marinilabiliales bacterium]